VGKWARPVSAGVELACCLDMRKLAVGHLALSTVAARRHARVSEWAMGVGAVRKELAVHLALVRSLGCG
jgi:cell division FtsZ-interacting protein ZapD